MSAIDVACERVGCEAKPGEPCKSIPRYDGLGSEDPELQMATAHQDRLYRWRGRARGER